ncbi:MAG: cysteine--tRNA ligase [Acidobacteria bacterium]|nr:cysteine--tRNA ligase [Acidobacteriota bacterium]
MEIRFHNTLTGQVEAFRALELRRVRIYTCGPTVYQYAHIGNFRTFVFQDILRRLFRYLGYELHHVMNITDVDDKTIANAAAAGLSLREYTDKYLDAFLADARLLNLETPEVLARATEHIDDMVALVERLIEKGYAYRSDDSYYYRIARFADYGKLSKIDLHGIRAGARVDVEEYAKTDPRDFALWKAAKPGEPSWETRIGRGRPGWHIECSAMSMKYLGPHFDIHTGGVDLVFPHHENEIAQSEAATGEKFVNVWLHAEHLVVDGEKMAKSKGNFYTLRDLVARGYKPSALRYLLASVPYRKLLNFTFDALHQATQSVERLRNFRLRLETEKFPAGSTPVLVERARQAQREFEAALADDLNTAEALAALFNLVRDINTAMDQGEFRQDDGGAVLDVLQRWDRIFGVLADDDLARLQAYQQQVEEPVLVPAGGAALSDTEVEARIRERAEARGRRDFARAVQIRQELADRGIIVEDTKKGVRWKRK